VIYLWTTRQWSIRSKYVVVKKNNNNNNTNLLLTIIWFYSFHWQLLCTWPSYTLIPYCEPVQYKLLFYQAYALNTIKKLLLYMFSRNYWHHACIFMKLDGCSLLLLNITIWAQISSFGSLKPQYCLPTHINIPLVVQSIIFTLKITVGRHSLAALSSCSSNHINCLLNLHTRGQKLKAPYVGILECPWR
jgi:hypothetical protein